MKGLFLTVMVIDSSPGYAEKIYGQVDAFRKGGIEMDIISLGDETTVTLIKHPNLNSDNAVVLQRFKKYYWNNRVKVFSAALQFIEKVNPQVIYIRHPVSDPIYIIFLHKLRQLTSSIIVLSEIPTYPYDRIHKDNARGKALWKVVLDRVVLEVDRFCRQFLKHFIDRIVCAGDADEIFGVKTISIHNGINVDAFTPICNSKLLASPLRLIGVANVMDSHGYDRIISAIQRRLRLNDMNHDMEFHIVSPKTPTLSRLKNEVEKNKLNNIVVFHGLKTGKDLDDIFAICHIAVGTLARHRVGVIHAADLKSREYMARGIPFVYVADQGIPNNYPFALQVPAGEAPINLNDIFDFAKQAYSSKEHSILMRDYAKHRWSWTEVMRPVFNEIEKMK